MNEAWGEDGMKEAVPLSWREKRVLDALATGAFSVKRASRHEINRAVVAIALGVLGIYGEDEFQRVRGLWTSSRR